MARREDYGTHTEADAGRFEAMHGGDDYDPYEGYEPEPEGPARTRPQAAGPLMDALRSSIETANAIRPGWHESYLNGEQFKDPWA